jgi:hypothetical protein
LAGFSRAQIDRQRSQLKLLSCKSHVAVDTENAEGYRNGRECDGGLLMQCVSKVAPKHASLPQMAARATARHRLCEDARPTS